MKKKTVGIELLQDILNPKMNLSDLYNKYIRIGNSKEVKKNGIKLTKNTNNKEY